VHAIRALLAGERLSVKASTFELNDGVLEFPVAKPPPQIAIVAHGRRMYELAGELADIVVIGNYATVEGITWAMEHIQKGASLRNEALGELKVIGRVDVCVADNRSSAREYARKRTRAFLRSGYYGAAFLEPLGLASLAGRDDWGDGEIERIVDATGFAGSTDDVSRGTASLIDSRLLHGVCARLETVPGGALSDAWHILSQGWAN
jgi:alkanesulfonate monooxygenase SsuD/methylene tetrahydromethanopterin reductase-like flavin-dependent oxidoreductase (luciferase family)